MFQSVRISLNYLKRLENMRGTSFVAAALNEQKKLTLSVEKIPVVLRPVI